MVKGTFTLLLLLTVIETLFSQHKIMLDSLRSIYNREKVKGGFCLIDRNNNAYYIYDSAFCLARKSSASTFKIFNTLVGLENYVVNDINFTFIRDGIKRNNPDWNKDQNLKQAFQNSCVWCYQEIARKVDSN
jgi:beta-lactamase class D